MNEEEEKWIYHYDEAKKKINANKLGSVSESKLFAEIDVYY